MEEKELIEEGFVLKTVCLILQGNVSFSAAGIRQAERETVYQYRYVGELQEFCKCKTHQKNRCSAT